MPKFYRYIIYRVYTYRLDENDDMPVSTTIFSMSIVHLLQFFSIYGILTRFYPFLSFLYTAERIFQILFLIAIIYAYYLIVYNEHQWNSYIEEFKDESDKQRKWGSIFVYSFTVGSVFLFFISLLFIRP